MPIELNSVEWTIRPQAATTVARTAADGSTAQGESNLQLDAVSQLEINTAVQELQEHFSTRSTPPELTVDYLSGLSVVSIRSVATGEVLVQFPDSEAVRMARLIKEGSSLNTVGLLSTTV